MNLPGFTAEASLGTASRWYRASRSFDAPTDTRPILPQAAYILDIQCYNWCLRYGWGTPRECFETCRHPALL